MSSLRSLRLDPFALLAEAGLNRDCVADPECKIPVEAVRRLLHVSGSAAGVDDFGLRLVDARPLSFLGPLALAVRDAATLREALQTACRCLPLHREGAVLTLEELGDGAIFRLEAIAGGGSPTRQSVEARIGAFHRIIRQLVGSAWKPRPVWFSHSAPANANTHLRMFGSWIEFERNWSGILLAARDLDAPLPAADPMMAQHVRQYLEPMLAQVNATLSERVHQLVHELLPSGSSFVELLSDRLGMNQRTLHRYLDRDGMSVSSIVDAVRVGLAQRYVEDDGRSLNEVSELLGFSAPSSFSRWFRTRFDSSPIEWRAKKSQQPESRRLAV